MMDGMLPWYARILAIGMGLVGLAGGVMGFIWGIAMLVQGITGRSLV